MAAGDRVALEVDWRATLLRRFGSIEPGTQMRASFAVFLHFDQGRIVSQHNYDCFEPL